MEKVLETLHYIYLPFSKGNLNFNVQKPEQLTVINRNICIIIARM